MIGQGNAATRRPILDNFRQFKTPSAYRYRENSIPTIHRKNINDVLADNPPTSQKGWLKTLRHFFSFAVDQGECKDDPTIGIKTTKPAKSSGYLTWSDEQIRW
jgi:site-specific recombinase XerD